MAYTENLITIEQQVSNHLLLFHLLSNKYQYKELYLKNEKESNIWLNSKKKQEKIFDKHYKYAIWKTASVESIPFLAALFYQ